MQRYNKLLPALGAILVSVLANWGLSPDEIEGLHQSVVGVGDGVMAVINNVIAIAVALGVWAMPKNKDD